SAGPRCPRRPRSTRPGLRPEDKKIFFRPAPVLHILRPCQSEPGSHGTRAGLTAGILPAFAPPAAVRFVEPPSPRVSPTCRAPRRQSAAPNPPLFRNCVSARTARCHGGTARVGCSREESFRELGPIIPFVAHP